jgi:hypothetical protein
LLGDYAKAIEYHTQDLAVAKEVGDQGGEGRAYANLGCAYQAQGDFSKAIEYHTQRLAIAKEVGDRAGEGAAYGNLGCAYQSQKDFSQAIEYHTQRLAIAKEVGDRAGEAAAYANLGCAYQSQGDFSQAIEYQAQCLAIAKEVGDRAGEGAAYANLGNAYQKLAHVQSTAALSMGVASPFALRAARQGPVAGADQAPGPHGRSSASACPNDRVREAAKRLQAAFDDGRPFANLHLAHLTFYAGQEDAALAHLKEHLSWRVQRGRDTCAGCGQTRGEDTPILTCSGCRVARFCSADHQKMASKNTALGGSLTTGRHKDICGVGVLRKWRERLTRALRTWWRSCSDMHDRERLTERERASERASERESVLGTIFLNG